MAARSLLLHAPSALSTTRSLETFTLQASQHFISDAPSVKIWKRVRGMKNQIAFSFPSTDGNYSLKVKEKTLQLEKIADVSDHEPYWFEKVDLHINEHYGLRSVVNPGHYLMKTVRHALSSQMKHEETNYTFDNITADFPAGLDGFLANN
ncbi:hypothetical protein F7725_013188 [Dissostichus mawsoni]|uniref:Uncharacterized protein n=1 Tax=Dissostichus mawsoni TaxID=36200 RepID=A0A7J5YPJ3_DISMA|nr:hypothetical protein F7725_013188 [Dissostichus mawsoni]